MAYQYPLNGGRINATITGNTAGVGSLVSTGTLSLAGGNNITLSQNGNAITISGANAPSGSINFSAGTTSSNLNSVVFSNSGGVSFGLNGGTITGTVATNYAASSHSHGNPTLNLTNMSGTTASASNGLTLSLSAPAISSLSQTGIISLSQNGNTISIGAPAFSIGMSTLGNTAGTTGTVSNQLILAGGNNVTLSQSTGAGGNTISISAPNQTAYQFSNGNGVSFGTNGSTVTATVATNYAASNHSHGNPTLNLTNLSGTTASASNGFTLSLSAASQSAQTQSNIQGVIASGSTNYTGNISFANSNGVTFGLSNNTITASVAAAGQTNQTIGLYASGNSTGQSSSSTMDARSLSISAQGGVSAGFSGGMMQMSAPAVSSLSQTGIVSISRNGNTISIGAPAFSAGASNLGNTAGNTMTVSNQIVFAGGNNITLSQTTGAGGATMSIIGGAGGGGGGGGVALSAVGGSISSGTASIAGAGALTASINGQTLNLNAPATSMLSAGDGISISTTGSTVVFQGVPTTGGGADHTWSYFNPQDAYPLAAGQHGQATLHLQPFQAPNVQFDRIVLPMVHSNASNSSGSQSVSFWVGFFTRSNNSLSLASSVSSSFAVSQSGTQGSYSLYGGQRLFTIGSTNTLLQSQYYVGIISRTTSAGSNASFSQLVASQINSNFSGIFGEASNASIQQTRGLGYYSVSTTGMPSSIAFSQLRGTGSMALRQPAIYLVSQTF